MDRHRPPLRAGTYFISIAVFATGGVAQGTLTATVETDTHHCHLDATYYPEWSNSATGVTLIFFRDGRLQICWADRESRRISRDWIGFPDG